MRGNSESIHKLDTLRQETQALSDKIRSERKALGALCLPKNRTSPRIVRKDKIRASNRITKAHPDVEPILSRPRPTVSGIRRVPALVSARGEVPFLRIKKPQPRILSLVIDNKLKRRWNWIVTRQRLDDELEMANAEDRWDAMMGETVEGSWRVPILESLREVKTKIRQSDEANAKLAGKMWEVVLKERELAEKEKNERIALKKQQLAARRKARKASESTGTDSGSHENAAADGSYQDSEHNAGADKDPTIAN